MVLEVSGRQRWPFGCLSEEYFLELSFYLRRELVGVIDDRPFKFTHKHDKVKRVQEVRASLSYIIRPMIIIILEQDTDVRM